MTLRKASEELKKVTLNLFASDWEWLQATFPKTGAGETLRTLLRTYRQQTEKKMAAAKAEVGDGKEIEVKL